jgi:hypothetical protein
MIYNAPVAYNEPNIIYSGTLVIKAAGLISPIILNNVTIFYSTEEDYSNYTTIAILSMDTDPSGVLSIEVLDSDLSALAQASVFSIQSAELSIIQ